MKKAVYLFLLSVLVFNMRLKSGTLNYEDIKEAYSKSFYFEQKSDYLSAIRSIWPVYKKFPNGYTVNLRLGWLFYLSGKYKDSIEFYKKASRLAPYSEEAKLGLLYPYFAMENWEKSEEILNEILKINYYGYVANQKYIYLLIKEKKYNAAEKIAKKMLLIYPTDIYFLTELANVYYHKQQYQRAKAILSDVLILNGSYIKAIELLKKINEQ